MADERRRLIYELLVEAKGMADTKKEMDNVGKFAERMGGQLKKIGAGLAITFTLKGIADAISEANVLTAQLQNLGLSGQAAALGLRAIEDISIATGQSMKDTGQVMGAAIEAVQEMGGSLDDAAKAALAFSKIAASEGKSAGDAAKQLDALQFAMQKNTIVSKEFISLLKESNTLQTAAETALGATTEKLVEMAKKGEITRVELEKIFDEMVRIGQQVETPATLEGLTNAFSTMAKSIVNAVTATAGLNAATKDVYGPLQALGEVLRAVGATLGYVISLIWNMIQTVVQLGLSIMMAIREPEKLLGALDVWFEQFKENANDVEKAGAQMVEAWDAIGSGAKATGVILDDEHKKALRRVEEAQRREEEMVEFKKRLAKFNEETRKLEEANERERERTARKAEERERRRIELMMAGEAAFRKELETNRAQNEALQNYLDESAEAAGDRAADQIEETFNDLMPAFEKALDDSIGMIQESADVLKDTFAELFEGGIHSAKEFFAVLLRGLAQVAAQRAALQMGEWIDTGLGKLLGALGSAAGGATGSRTGPVMAKGGAFNRGRLIPFAGGGVVHAPTLFGMGGGATGLMGEAGPEAIMPLKRGADGKLGVAGAPTVNIINQTGVAATAKVTNDNDRLTIVLEAAQMGARLAESRMNRSLRTGYGDTAQSMQRVYGLRRGGGG